MSRSEVSHSAEQSSSQVSSSEVSESEVSSSEQSLSRSGMEVSSDSMQSRSFNHSLYEKSVRNGMNAYPSGLSSSIVSGLVSERDSSNSSFSISSLSSALYKPTQIPAYLNHLVQQPV